MRICLFDDVPGGHHPAYLNGVAKAVAAVADHVIVASPNPVDALDETTGTWIPVRHTKHRQFAAGRAALHQVLDAALNRHTDVFIDLYLDKSLWAWPRACRLPNVVHVLHHAHHYTGDRPGTIGRLKNAAARRKLSSLVARGDKVAVHTARAFSILAAFLPAESIVHIGYPIVTGRIREHASTFPHDGQAKRVLFVGRARVEKGADLLLDALRWLPREVEVRFVGKQDAARRSQLDAGRDTSQVTWVDRFVSDDELEREIDHTDLIVLPYLERFGHHGGASGVLLDALARGTPIVASSVLVPQLPPGFRGGVVVPPGDARSLADGIVSAFAELDTLRERAQQEGPAFIRERHSFPGYVQDLLAAVDG